MNLAILTFGSLNTLLELGFPSQEASDSFFNTYVRAAGTILTPWQDEPIRVVRHRTPAQAQRERAISKLTKVFRFLEQEGVIGLPIKADYATASIYVDRFRVASLKFPRGQPQGTHELVLHNEALQIFPLNADEITASFTSLLSE